jgi:hypothetical protein
MVTRAKAQETCNTNKAIFLNNIKASLVTCHHDLFASTIHFDQIKNLKHYHQPFDPKTLSSKDSLPSSHSRRTAIAVIGLLMLAMRSLVVAAILRPTPAMPYPAKTHYYRSTVEPTTISFKC